MNEEGKINLPIQASIFQSGNFEYIPEDYRKLPPEFQWTVILKPLTTGQWKAIEDMAYPSRVDSGKKRNKGTTSYFRLGTRYVMAWNDGVMGWKNLKVQGSQNGNYETIEFNEKNKGLIPAKYIKEIARVLLGEDEAIEEEEKNFDTEV